MVHGETGAREEVQETLVLGLVNVTPGVGKSGRVSHVNGNGVTVTKRWVWDQLVEGRPAVIAVLVDDHMDEGTATHV